MKKYLNKGILVLAGLTMSGFASAESEITTAKKLVDEIKPLLLDNPTDGHVTAADEGCVMTLRKVASGQYALRIETDGDDGTLEVRIDPKSKMTYSEKDLGGGGSVIRKYRLAKDHGVNPYILIQTYEDISDYDLTISETGKKIDEVTCSFQE